MHARSPVTTMINWYAAIVIALVMLGVPAAYFLVSLQYAAGSVEAEAEINGRFISQIVTRNPKLWEFEQSRIEEFLSRRPRAGLAEARRVFTTAGTLIAESADVLPPPHLTRTAELHDSGIPVGRIEVTRSLRPLVWECTVLFLVLLPAGVTSFVVLRTVPIRAIERGERALRAERDRAQRYLDIAGVIFLALDRAGTVTMINQRGIDVIGRAERELPGRDWFEECVPAPRRTLARISYIRFIAQGAGYAEQSEETVLTKNGGERTIAWYRIVLDDGNGAVAGSLWSGEDVTERRALEEQLRHARRLEAIGQLAGGVAHDFNNLLSAIIGYGSMLHMSMQKDDPHRHSVEQILAAADRAAYVTKSLLAFSRKQIMNPKPALVNGIVQHAEHFLRRLIGADIEMRTRLAPDSVTVFADAVQIEQAILNLATNARDAMPGGGTLTIGTDRIEVDTVFARAHGLDRGGSYAVITVSDTGTGMDASILDKIFEPYFTTKEVGKGTGLGLANVYGIVKQHNGAIEVASAPGKGATFRIYLPALQTVAEAMRKEDVPSPGGAETVLVAEDEDSVRSMTRSILQQYGYTVIEAADGEEAVGAFRRHRDAVNLVLLDVIMPKKNGVDAYREIQALRPDVKVLFMSGYTADLLPTQGVLEENKPILAKPMAPAELLKKVREVLDQ